MDVTPTPKPSPVLKGSRAWGLPDPPAQLGKCLSALTYQRQWRPSPRGIAVGGGVPPSQGLAQAWQCVNTAHMSGGRRSGGSLCRARCVQICNTGPGNGTVATRKASWPSPTFGSPVPRAPAHPFTSRFQRFPSGLTFTPPLWTLTFFSFKTFLEIGPLWRDRHFPHSNMAFAWGMVFTQPAVCAQAGASAPCDFGPPHSRGVVRPRGDAGPGPPSRALRAATTRGTPG